MYVHYCSESGGWRVEACDDKWCEGTHLSLAVGFDDLFMLLNLIDLVWRRLQSGDDCLREIALARKWMGTGD